ncbi:UvrD-helicase domain-containing protein [Priestia megaterium]|uniref:UvrD-helicase domain-containing protein n=1 Tax=Priestia megaterium TaxID=1404 RepID=UPI00234E75B6|nr:UvrD-helicase domain-containing protein [Priestia megaterium]MDC7724447.1 UvrD-helicase domain-containing protein [Priestia megaterium]
MVSQIESQIREALENYNNFLVEAGAGSGKTWSLVQALSYLIETKESFLKRENKKIVCITYTNVARDEIINRLNVNDIIKVNTIHEFLWEVIKPFQKELRNELIIFYQNKIETANKNREKHLELIGQLSEVSPRVEYREYKIHAKGIITHDDILWLFVSLIQKYKSLQKLIEDSFPFIFIDEYQDSNKGVIEAFLEAFFSNQKVVLGLFGDHFQKIYDGSIGEVDAVKYKLKVIKKSENYRCSTEIINILNKLRTDIQQIPVGEERRGKGIFYYLPNYNEIEKQFKEQLKNDFDGLEIENFKNLYLVNKKIAQINGYFNLYELYNSKRSYSERFKKKDYILNNKNNRDCEYANLLFEVENLLHLFKENRAQDIFKIIRLKVNNREDLNALYNTLNNLLNLSAYGSIGEVLDFLISSQILDIGKQVIRDFRDESEEFIKRLKEISYKEFVKLYLTLKEDSLYSTQHGTKGAEFDNVLCFIDDNEWRNYNLENYLINNQAKLKIVERTRNLFYVVCSRAKYRLAIVCKSELGVQAQDKIKDIFGVSNFITIENETHTHLEEERIFL